MKKAATTQATIFAIIAVMGAGCGTTRQPGATPGPAPRPIIEIGAITGPDAQEIAEDFDRMAAEMGSDGPTLRALLETAGQTYSDTHGTHAEYGPYTCEPPQDRAQCWHGITRIASAGNYRFEWPQARRRGLIAHETMHSLLHMMIATGDLTPEQWADGHPEYITTRSGKQVNIADVVRWRWPSRVMDSAKAGDPWLDFIDHCGTGKLSGGNVRRIERPAQPAAESALRIERRGGAVFAGVDMLAVAGKGVKRAFVETGSAIKHNPWPVAAAALYTGIAADQKLWPFKESKKDDPAPIQSASITLGSGDASATIQNCAGDASATITKHESGSGVTEAHCAQPKK
tara:strand:+ start:231 stop:1262 length:1032 start_codon:yes stop_codon:yes gene_type:complete